MTGTIEVTYGDNRRIIRADDGHSYPLPDHVPGEPYLLPGTRVSFDVEPMMVTARVTNIRRTEEAS